MGSPCPPHWTFAARAAYFGDRMCAFCDHRNPAGAKFCNDCASPLHLKPCKKCDAINDHAATNCYKCGVACPVSFGNPTSVLAAAGSTLASTTPCDVAVAATVTQPLLVASPLRAGGRLLGPGLFLAAAIATIVIVGAKGAYRIDAAAPDATRVPPQPVPAFENNATTATPAVPAAVEWKAAEPERAAQVAIPATNAEAPKRASVRQPTVRVPAKKHANAPQRPMWNRQAPVGGTPPTQAHARARVGARVAQTSQALRAHPWQAMHVSLARCGGDLLARIVCDQRVRRHFCEGHWGEAPECASGVANEHGQ